LHVLFNIKHNYIIHLIKKWPDDLDKAYYLNDDDEK